MKKRVESHLKLHLKTSLFFHFDARRMFSVGTDSFYSEQILSGHKIFKRSLMKTVPNEQSISLSDLIRSAIEMKKRVEFHLKLHLKTSLFFHFDVRRMFSVGTDSFYSEQILSEDKSYREGPNEQCISLSDLGRSAIEMKKRAEFYTKKKRPH